MAEWPRSAARWTKSSGREAASRKLNAERVWKSTKLVINSLHKPLLLCAIWRTIQIDAVQRPVAQCQVVLVAIPGTGMPPIAARSPRPRDLQDLALKHSRPQTFGSDARFERWSEVSKRQQNPRRSSKSRAMRIEQFRIPDVLFTYQPPDLAQRQLEFFRLRRGRRE